MSQSDIAATIEAAWERRDQLSPQSKGANVEAIEAAIDLLDSGQARVASRSADGVWTTQQWLKKAVLLSFRVTPNQLIGGAGGANGVDPSPGPCGTKCIRSSSAGASRRFSKPPSVPCLAPSFAAARTSRAMSC